jgi:hypothetical protein
MTLHHRLAGLAVAAALVLAGCKAGSNLAPIPGPPGDFAYAYASPDCAPWDGRAVSILLTTTPSKLPDEARPQLRLALYPREAQIGDRTYAWPAAPEMATGSRCTAAGCESARSGEIRLRAARPDSALEGTVTLRFGPADSLTGGFRAVWRDRRMLCG